MIFSKRKVKKDSTERTYIGNGTVVVTPSQYEPVDLTEIYNRLAALEQKVNSINLDNYLSKVKSDETTHTLTAARYISNIIQGKAWDSTNGNGYRIFDATDQGSRPTFNMRTVEQADSQTTAPFTTVDEFYTWSGLVYDQPKFFTFTITNDVDNLNITHQDAELMFYAQFICNDRRVTVETTTITFTVDGDNEDTLTPDEDGLCYIPLTTGTHDYHITATYTVSVIMRSGQSIPAFPHVTMYGTDRENEQTTVTWINSTTTRHTLITPSEVTVKSNSDGYMLKSDGLYKITGGTTTKLI